MKRSQFASSLVGATALSLTMPSMSWGAATKTLRFHFAGIHIYETRSPNTDTNYASMSLKVGQTVYGPVTKYIGDLGKGDHGVDLDIVADIPDTTDPFFTLSWAVVNDDGGKDAGINAAANVGLAVVGAALDYVPVVGTALSVLYSALVNPFKNHNGPVVAQQYTNNGSALDLPHPGDSTAPLNGYAPGSGAKNVGHDLPGNEHSNYDSVVYIIRV